MAQYKVPQDVEADDKLLGPFSFRQFIYLIIAAGGCFLAFLLFQIFPLLVIIPIPAIIFFAILALPIKKDQPMETYLSAIIDYYLKPQKRIWMPGQPDTAITITAPKQVEEKRTKDLSQEEAGRRLSFLADIVDTEGYAIKETNTNLRDDVASEASEAKDIFEANQTFNLDQSLQQSTANRHAQLVEQMRDAISKNSIYGAAPAPAVTPAPAATPTPAPVQTTPTPQISQFQPPVMPIAQPIQPTTPVQQPSIAAPVNVAASNATIQPDIEEIREALATPTQEEQEAQDELDNIIDPNYQPLPQPQPTPPPEPEPKPAPAAEPINEDLVNLANNPDFSIETIAKQAKRIAEQESNNNEVYISLH